MLAAAIQAFKDARQSAPAATSSESTAEGQCKDIARSESQHPERAVVSEQKAKDTNTAAKKAGTGSKEKLAKTEQGPKAVTTPGSQGKPSGKGAGVNSQHQGAPAPGDNSPGKASTRTTEKDSVCEPADNSSNEEEESEEEKEYFDDSTEERFYKQSSASEDSDSDSGDDFFIGKVRRTRKKECGVHSSAKELKPLPKVPSKANTLETHWDVRNDKHRPIPEARKLESVFFHSLSGPKSSRR